MIPRDRENGVILVNVLVALALGSALVVLMVTSQDAMLDRARRMSAMAQAQALARGAEASVVVALRRDMTDAPDTDSYGEPWALAQQQAVTLDTGRFEVTITDAQSRLDLNMLADGGLAQAQLLARLTAALDLTGDVAPRITARMVRGGPVTSLADIPGLDAVAIDALSPFVTFLPVPGAVNLNTADEELIGVLLQNRTAAARLVGIRDRNGGLTQADLDDVGIIGAQSAGLTSNVFDMVATAEVDDVSVTLQSRMVRVADTGTPEVIIISRRFGVGADGALPDIPDQTE